jgi:UDP-N-acetylglucosamine 2-epimerase (non-hydrolysing)
MVEFERVLAELSPELVLVVGDVNSTLACALVTAKSSAALGHVEAGLRSRDWSMPEEVNRVVTDRVSDHLFAPSSDAVDNLIAEGYPSDRIHLVGNTMVDSLLTHIDDALARPVLSELNVQPRSYALVTLHRPSNVDDPDMLSGLMSALEQLSRDIPVVFPAHPRTRDRLQSGPNGSRVMIVPALGYLDCIALEAQARLVLTDSGGMQEETTVLGVPCLTLRENTERPITVSQGTNMIVGRDAGRILSEARRILLEGVPSRKPELWDGHAGERIAEVIMGLKIDRESLEAVPRG